MKKLPVFQILGGSLAVTLLLVGAASATPAKLLAGTGFLSGPGAKYNALAALDPGAKVDVIWCGTTENWCLVTFHNKKGWVPLDLLNLRPGGGGSVADGSSSSGGSSGGGSAGGGKSGGSKSPGGGDGGGAAAAAETAAKQPGGGGGSTPTFSQQGSGITYTGGGLGATLPKP
jgi:hypothetical protein